MDRAGKEVNYKLDKLILKRSCFTLNWISQLNIIPKVILDIGSYDGGDGIRFKQKFPNAEVYSFEGCPERQKIIEEYIGDYGVHLVKNAVTDYSGTTQWYSATCARTERLYEKYSAQGSIYKHTNNYKERYKFITQHEPKEVPCISINDFCKNYNLCNIDVAHIDTEGAEYDVVKGFGSMRPSIVYVETINRHTLWENSKNTKELHNLLSNMNYILIMDLGSDRLYKNEN